MKQTDFSYTLQKFFSEYLAHQRGNSIHTIKSYRDTFRLFLRFMLDHKKLKSDKMTLEKFTSEAVKEFLKYLSKTRKNSTCTRNQRLAAIHSFVGFLQYENPEKMFQWQRIKAIPMNRQDTKKPIEYLTQDEIGAVMSTIRIDTPLGLRDKTLLLMLYDTGARVHEIVNLSVGDIRLEKPSQVVLHGKGNKVRIVPLMRTTVGILKSYMENQGFMDASRSNNALFCNRKGSRISRFGIAYLLQKYVAKARKKKTTIPKTITPHKLRHSKAMHLLEEGCSQVVIQHLLGHANLKTTSIYAKADSKTVRAALEKVSRHKVSDETFSWQKDVSLLDWLNDL